MSLRKILNRRGRRPRRQLPAVSLLSASVFSSRGVWLGTLGLSLHFHPNRRYEPSSPPTKHLYSAAGENQSKHHARYVLQCISGVTPGILWALPRMRLFWEREFRPSGESGIGASGWRSRNAIGAWLGNAVTYQPRKRCPSRTSARQHLLFNPTLSHPHVPTFSNKR